MLSYILKVVHVEDNTRKLFLSEIIEMYPREEKNCGDYYGTVLPNDGSWYDMVLPEIEVFRINNVPKSKDSILTSFHIGGT